MVNRNMLPPSVKDPIRILWHFWNHCFLGRTSRFQPRKILIKQYECSVCGIGLEHYVLWYDTVVCQKCKASKEKECFSDDIENNRRKSIESAKKFEYLLGGCEKKGTCDILSAHKELLINDDERIRTEFMLDLICKNNYNDKWNKIKQNIKELNASRK